MDAIKRGRNAVQRLTITAMLISLGCSCSGPDRIEIRKVRRENRDIIEIENDIYKTVLVPEITRLPLSYFFKLTGHEHFVHPRSLETPNEGFQMYGGVIDSIPWVSGIVDGRRLPDKGYLYSSPWEYKTGKTQNSAWFYGETSFDYNDPVTGKQSTLFFGKRITGYSRSSLLKMDYLIRNTGKTSAKFTFSMHSRTGIAECDEGDYFYAPGEKCYVYYMNNMPELEREGIHPPCWAEWPLKEATEFIPGKEQRNIFVFVPSNWCVVGDDKYEEGLFFIAGPVELPGRQDIMKMGMFMSTSGYVVEPSPTYSIVGNPEEWDAEDSTISLEPGHECRFTVNLAAYKGISRALLPDIKTVYPEYIVFDEPGITIESGDVEIFGKVAFQGHGRLILKAAERVLAEKDVFPGMFDLSSMGKIDCRECIPCTGFTLLLKTDAGIKELQMQKAL